MFLYFYLILFTFFSFLAMSFSSFSFSFDHFAHLLLSLSFFHFLVVISSADSTFIFFRLRHNFLLFRHFFLRRPFTVSTFLSFSPFALKRFSNQITSEAKNLWYLKKFLAETQRKFQNLFFHFPNWCHT